MIRSPMMRVVCAICGAESNVPGSALPQAEEPPDFDTRPGEPLRSTLLQWIQECPSCGYAAEDITRAAAGAPEIIASPEFARVRDDDTRPPQARPFLTYAHLLDRLRQPADAGWSCLHAAWACDDARAIDAASLCRCQAIEFWKKGKLAGVAFSDDMASEFALVTDVYRRTGDFERATVTCAEGLDIEDIPPVIERVLRRQMVLIQARDISVHSLREIL